VKWKLNYSETLVSPLSVDEVLYILNSCTKELQDTKQHNETKIPDLYRFTGYIKGNRFQVSQLIKYPQNFIPKIEGKVEGTNKGSLIYLKFSLFRGTLFLLYLWIIGCVLMSLTFLFLNYKPLIVIISTICLVFNYLIAVANFSLHLKNSVTLIEKTLSI